MGMTLMDAFIACHDAKYTHWLIRTSQADPGITLSVPLGRKVAAYVPAQDVAGYEESPLP